MKILHIIPSLQHPNVRGPHRHYHFLKELSQRHEITLLTPLRAKVSAAVMEEIASYTHEILTFPVNGTREAKANGAKPGLPLFGGSRLDQLLHFNATVKIMKQAFTRLVQQEAYDVVFFHGKSVFPVIADCRTLPIVTDFCDATSMRVRSKMNYAGKAKLPLLGLRYLQIRQIEKKLINKTPHVAFISCRDREAILGAEDKSMVIPNGIDLAYWRRQTHRPQPNCLVFTGIMNYAPNEDAALYLIDEILPYLKPVVPNLEILIVGRDPTPALLKSAQRHPEVTVTGFVDDMRTYLERATVFAAPLRFGSGMQNKIQEALAMEVPVVTTSTAAAGLRTHDGQDAPLYIADAARPFAESVIKLLANPAEQTRLATVGRQFAERNFSWPRSAAQFEQMCLAAINQN